jgi:CsoR family transcriptional regulator, copper-sensing transcriptional repressor
MSTHGYIENKDQLGHRLARIEGQVRGIARMIEEERYCIDVVTQVSAARAALDQVALDLLTDHVRHCMSENDRTDELMGAVRRLVQTS